MSYLVAFIRIEQETNFYLSAEKKRKTRFQDSRLMKDKRWITFRTYKTKGYESEMNEEISKGKLKTVD